VKMGSYYFRMKDYFEWGILASKPRAFYVCISLYIFFVIGFLNNLMPSLICNS
jgi:hypothetical protein